ncbi:DMT family transporter [Campylobacter corcagiensis]|uniref:EamA family transporter n=1 Tax=Campylobacter corcagiensis TaxID=1448857 RepID=A0A7M1LHR9_9BACT|nr:DMT family transporter [Campylobacter corcagiensis]QKF65525.1 EamA/RhaT family transporter, type 3 [Campylobacter corcagiensis]QOQ87903.1 EamA family transporter [Campylobacter corcagiensis]
MEDQKSSYGLGIIVTLLSALFWGFSSACGQYLFEQKNISPEWLVTTRLILSGILLLSYSIYKQKAQILLIFTNKKDTLILIFYAIFGLYACQYTYYLTIDLSNAAIATILQYTSPIFIIIFVGIVDKTLPSLKEILALICVVIGVFILATHGDPSNLVIPPKAIITGLLSALCILVYSITPIKINRRYGILTCLALGLSMSGVMSSVMCRAWSLEGVSDLPGVGALLGVVLCGTVLSFSLYMKGLSILGPTKASLIASIEPVTSAFFIWIWLGVTFVAFDFLGFFLIIASTIILAKK